jgi:hypothetical protein
MPLPKKPKENSHEKKIQFFIYKKKTKNEETTMKYLQSKTMLVTRTKKTLLI